VLDGQLTCEKLLRPELRSRFERSASRLSDPLFPFLASAAGPAFDEKDAAN